MAGRLTRDEVDQLMPQLSDLRDRVAAGLLALDAGGGLAVLRAGPPGREIADLWRALEPRLDALWAGHSTLSRVVDAATALRGQGLSVSRARLDDLTTLLRDPIALDALPAWYRGATVAQLALRLDADRQVLAKELADLEARINAIAGRRAGLLDALAELAAAESATKDAYALATTKIHDPQLPHVVEQEPELRRRLESSDVTELPAVEQAVAAALTSTTERRRFAEGLLERRDELRGRLEAYRMKAVRQGRSEHKKVLAGYATARTLLWTAPCDLPAATRAVVAFQRSLLDSPEGGAA
jgi:hypothetical protein